VSTKCKFASVVLVLLLSSCASIMTGKHDVLNVNSSPVGAKFTTNTGVQGTTPAKIEVPDDVDVQFTFEMPGYAPASFTAARHMSAWVWGNILIGGVIGLIVDFASGGVYTHDSTVNVTLAQLIPATPQP
jgi:hypothetical protein